jgi:uncharacterized repeat protein (TIGR03803 family)
MRGKIGVVVAVALILVTGAVAATVSKKAARKPTVTLTTLYNFTDGSDGGFPYERVIPDKNGDLFGTTCCGGSSSYGVVYELVNSSGTYTEKVLYSFTGSTDGCFPYSELLMDKSGNLYGSTSECGSGGYGTVFELVNSGGTYTESTLHGFSYSDGAYPYGALATDKTGNLYGTTAQGGTDGYGTVWEISSGTLTTLANMDYSTMGGYPYGGLNMDHSGNLWGTTCCGGTGGDGVVFEMINSSGTWNYNAIHGFSYTDGADPYYGRVVIGKAGHVFGTAFSGGTSGYGVVWGLKESNGTWTEFTLYNFTDSSGDGAYPFGGLRLTHAGHLAGTTYYGGANSEGTAFELVHGSGGWTETLLHTFAGSDGSYPYAGANADKAGNIYGATADGGTSGAGTVFMITGAK